jgi:hypothetical protein
MAKKAATTAPKVEKKSVKKSEVIAAAPVKKPVARKRVTKPKPQSEETDGLPAYEDVA